MTPRVRAVWAVTLTVLVMAAGNGCSRLDTLNRRLAAVEDAKARQVLLDALWAQGSKYRWADHAVLRAEVTRTLHRPLGDTATDEVWRLDFWADTGRIEVPERRQVTVFEGSAVRVFVDGRETADLETRAVAAADARLVRELLPMPLSLAAPGRTLAYVGTRTGPGEARQWERLEVAYHGPGVSPDDQTVVEFRKNTHRVDAVLIRWSQFPLAGRPMRVLMDDYRKAGGLGLSRRWRVIPIDESGAATGPALCTVRVNRLEFDPDGAQETVSAPP